MHTRKGFTLIELLVVITIIAILAVIVFTQVQGLTARARNTTTQTTVREAGNAINVFRNSDGTADGVIHPGAIASATSRLSSNTGNTAWGAFGGTLTTTGTLQYPVRITRTASAATATGGHALLYRLADGTGAFAGGAAGDLVTLTNAQCVIVSGALVNDANAGFAFYRNGTIGTGGTGNTAGGWTTHETVANLNCTTP